LNEEQAAAENVDTEDEKHYGEVKRKERIAILASEPSPAMTALKRARKEKGLVTGAGGGLAPGMHSEDEASEAGLARYHVTSAGRSAYRHDTASDYTRSPSPVASRGFQAVNAKGTGDMRINNLLNNDDAISELSPPHGDSTRRGPGRGNWRRNKQDPNMTAQDRSQHVRLLPNNAHLSFVNEGPLQSTSSSYHNIAPSSIISSFRDHVPTPSYQAQKRHRGITQHQSAVQSHRKQQIDYTLDKRIRKVHIHARAKREAEGAVVRAWKRIRVLPTDYDSEEEQIKLRKAKEKAEKDDEWRSSKGKENIDSALDENEPWRRPRVYLAGFAQGSQNVGCDDVGEEARSLAKAFRRCSRRLERWQESNYPGDAMIDRRHRSKQGRSMPRRAMSRKEMSMDQDGYEDIQGSRRSLLRRQRSATGRVSEHAGELEPDDEDGGPDLDEEDRELLGEVDADESEEDEDEDMGDD
jgi:Ino eighty subunit 1